MMALRGGCPALVATPGRLLDLLAHNALRLGDVQALVLDEADRLLDLGFADELGRVLAAAAGTAPDAAVLGHAARGGAGAGRAGCCRSAARWTRRRRPGDGPAAPAPDIRQRAIVVDTARRTPLLRHLLASEGWPRTLVFVATQYASEHVADKLRRGGVKAAALHGRQSTGRRAAVLADLQAGRLQLLVATDLAARGIDLPGLPVVVQVDLPRSAVDHVHRIGRTGRAGASGQAVSFICADAPGSEAHFRLIEKRQQQRVPREVMPASSLPPSRCRHRHGGHGRHQGPPGQQEGQAARGRSAALVAQPARVSGRRRGRGSAVPPGSPP
jgi:ATP-dependent RNA helicase RhlE